MNKLLSLGLLSALTLARAVAAQAPPGPVSDSPGGVVTSSAFSVSLHPDGRYEIAINGTDWTLDGSLPAGFEVLAPTSGSDHLGRYRELSARSPAGRAAAMRIYDGRPVVYFLDTWLRGGGNDHSFPAFQRLPSNSSRYSFKRERFSHYEFNALGEDGPWVLFNESHAIVLSPADHFRISSMLLAGDGSTAIGVDPGIASLPDGFSHGTVLAAGIGVDTAMEAWGSALQAVGGKHPLASENDDDPLMSKLGYWTDNGSSYYYKFDSHLGYTGTLVAVKDSFAKAEIPLGYMQLDSWFYPKGSPPAWDKNGEVLAFGEDVYRGDTKLFPEGLAAFHQKLGLPLVTHARWIAPTSPYRREFKMSGNVVIDPKFWDETAAYLEESGVIAYEQDWLDHNASTDLNVTDPSAFLENMAGSMKGKRVNLQYCMALPSDFMASAQFSNVTSIRTSDDRFERARWDAFLYDSRMATALGSQPWTDVFMSPETGNLLISTLSGGPVGVGDSLGAVDFENLRHVVNAEGELVKPDRGLRPIDRMYTEDAAARQEPMIAVAATGNVRVPDAYYLFAYPRKASDRNATVSLPELGIKTGAIAYDWVRKIAVPVPLGGAVTIEFDGKSQDGGTDKTGSPDGDTWGYVVVVPYAKDGMALLGDTEKFATLAENGVSRRIRQGKPPAVVIDFGDDREPRIVTGYATQPPHVESKDSTATLSSYDSKTGIFQITVASPKAEHALVSIE